MDLRSPPDQAGFFYPVSGHTNTTKVIYSVIDVSSFVGKSRWLQVQREKGASKSDDEKVGSKSDDVSLENESHSQDSGMALDNNTETSGVNESIAKLPISAMLRCRKHECGSKSEDKSYSNDKSHYESKLKDIEEWIEMAKENCGVEIKMEDIIKEGK